MAPSADHSGDSREVRASPRPWYREPWPWLLIGLTGAAVLGSLVTLWIALAHPDELVLDAAEYQRLDLELKAAGDEPEAPVDD